MLVNEYNPLSMVKYIAKGATGGYYFYGHLWYLYALMLLYMITPILRAIKEKSKKLIDMFLVIWVIFSILWPLLYHFVDELKPNSYFSLDVMGGYLGWYVLGWRLGEIEYNFDIHKRYLLVGVFILSGITTIAMQIVIQMFGDKDTYFQDFTSPTIVFMSVALFLLIKSFTSQSKKYTDLKPAMRKLRDASLGIYLVHFFIRDVVSKVWSSLWEPGLLYLLIVPWIVFFVSWGIVELFSMNKSVRKFMFTI